MTYIYEGGIQKMDAEFTIKDSGKREGFQSGMVRDTARGKTNFLKVLDGPMFDRWAEHLTKGAIKYPDVALGVANWTLAAGEEEYQRFRQSAFRHFRGWLRGDRDEDHAAAVFFNINGAEYVRAKSAPALRCHLCGGGIQDKCEPSTGHHPESDSDSKSADGTTGRDL